MQKKSLNAAFKPVRLLTLILGALLGAALVSPDAMAATKKAPAKKTSQAVGKPGGASNALATVNGVPISTITADTFVNEQLAQGAQDTPELRKAVRDELIRREVVTQAARAEKLDKQPAVIAQLELAKQAILIRAYVQDYLKKNPTPEAAIQAEYDKLKASSTEKEFKARHILVDKEEEAKAIIAKLDKGGKFEDLAKDSKDPGSKDAGGELGWSQPKDFVKPFADAMVTLEKGKYTTAPVKSEFGWHVIKLDDSRVAEPPPYEQVKAQIAQHLQQQKIEALILGLQAKAKIQ